METSSSRTTRRSVAVTASAVMVLVSLLVDVAVATDYPSSSSACRCRPEAGQEQQGKPGAVVVCGSDGRTYPSACALECAQGTNRDLIARWEGPCSSSAAQAHQHHHHRQSRQPNQQQQQLQSPSTFIGRRYDFTGLEECSSRCASKALSCVAGCGQNADCLVGCVRDISIRCNCDCRSHLRSLERSAAGPDAGRSVPEQQHPLPRVSMSNVAFPKDVANQAATRSSSGSRSAVDDLNRMAKCFRTHIEQCNQCEFKCATEECMAKCLLAGLDEVCHCGAAALKQSLMLALGMGVLA